MKLKRHPVTFNGQRIEPDEFAFRDQCVATGNRGAPEHMSDGDPHRPVLINLPCLGPNPPGNQGDNPRCVLSITEGPAEGHVWHWDGNIEEPTLSPSIGCDHRCGWHGHLIAGEMVPTR